MTEKSDQEHLQSAAKVPPTSSPHIPNYRRVLSQSIITDEIFRYPYPGKGTQEDPYQVEWILNDPINPLNFPGWKKWFITLTMAFSTLSITFSSSAYSGCILQIMEEFNVSQEVAITGVALFVLSFAIGPGIWGPLSELYGRQMLFIGTYGVVTAFSAGACGSQNITTLLVLRFFSGAFGASALTNAGGTVSDLFTARERGLAAIVYVSAPFLGPTLGPLVGGFLGETEGWRWVHGLIAIFTGALWIAGSLLVPETYAPVLLKRRAQKLSRLTGKVYKSKLDISASTKTPQELFNTAMIRPWVLLFREPIVMLLSLYTAIIYGTLYLTFAAFPIVFEGVRGWSQGITGLSFIGVIVGQILGMIYAAVDNKRYKKVADRSPDGRAPPEARLNPSMVGAVALPIGLFWFAWTNSRSVHWIVCLIGVVPFGFAQVVVFLSVIMYLIDSYTVYAASVLAATAVLRALLGAGFPMFTDAMYTNLGIHWASSIPAFLGLMCAPFPFLFYVYGKQIRARCKYSADAGRILEAMLNKTKENPPTIDDVEAGQTNESDDKSSSASLVPTRQESKA